MIIWNGTTKKDISCGKQLNGIHTLIDTHTQNRIYIELIPTS